MRGLQTMDGGAAKTGRPDAKTHELIALAVAVTTRCDGCIAVHTKKAVEQGATREEIAEALGVAMLTRTFSRRAVVTPNQDRWVSLPQGLVREVRVLERFM